MSSADLRVETEVKTNGDYSAIVTYQSDLPGTAEVRVVLDRPGALAYAVAAMVAVQRAEHDAAVMVMLTDLLGISRGKAFAALDSMRKGRRGPAYHSSLSENKRAAPLAFVPRTGPDAKPLLQIMVRGQYAGGVELSELREHAMAVLRAPEGAALDSELARWLVSADIDQDWVRKTVGYSQQIRLCRVFNHERATHEVI